jgi:NAD(P)-dependent dehydrogenase (short-subunit alcohol dehydrogenase family)
MELGLSGRRAVVTGGSKGIGYAVARELAAEGVAVAICARNPAEVEAAAAELSGHGGTVHGFVADVTKAEEVERFVAAAADALGGIDVLVNNAGAAHPGRFETLTDEAWQGDIDVKLFSQIRCSRAALPHLRASSAARIININAIYARYPDPSFFATTVNRAACLNFSKALAIELGPEKILVNSVNIGFVVTPQWENIRQRRSPELSEEEFFAAMASDEVPLGRFGDVEEVSGVVAFLASDRASYLTGASIDVAGGLGKYV